MDNFSSGRVMVAPARVFGPVAPSFVQVVRGHASFSVSSASDTHLVNLDCWFFIMINQGETLFSKKIKPLKTL